MIINKRIQVILSVSAIIILSIGFYYSINAIFGVFMLVWIINDLIRQETYLLGPISRVEFPKLYWIVLLMWVGFSFAYFIF